MAGGERPEGLTYTAARLDPKGLDGWRQASSFSQRGRELPLPSNSPLLMKPIAVLLVGCLLMFQSAVQAEPLNDAPANLTYRLSNGSDAWDPAIRARITKAMDEAVAIYRQHGVFDKRVTANYNPRTPTADANYNGWINFGGQIGTRTALHEICHTLGVGTHPHWRSLIVEGKWTGEHAIAQLREFDGPDAVLHADRQHFWPYGLNFDREDGEENRRRHVLMVAAFRRDLGIE
jgi:hypothetical protein